MIHAAILSEAVTSLAAAKQRSLLALIGIVIGIGSVIAMVSVSAIVKEEALRQFKEMGTDLFTLTKDFSGGGGRGGGRGGAAAPRGLQPADLNGLLAAAPALVAIAPSISALSQTVSQGGKPLERASLVGVTETFPTLARLRVTQGRFLTDLDEGNRYAVIGADLARQLAARGVAEPIGTRLRIGDLLFTVIGVQAPASYNSLASLEPDQSVLIPLAQATRLQKQPEINSILARVKPGHTNAEAMAQAQAYFQARRQPVRARSPEEIIAQMEKQMRMFTLLAGAIGSISLIVGGIGVMNVMLVSVTERRREIGVRRALGARQGDIQQQFLVESVILSLLGGLFGILLGVGASWLTAYLAYWKFLLSLDAILLGVGVASAVGIFFGFYPARQAARLDPIQALRAD